MTRKQMIYGFLKKMKSREGSETIFTTEEIAKAVGVSRANASYDLNRLFEEKLVDKMPGWPVRYRASVDHFTPLPKHNLMKSAEEVFEGFIGYNGSMSIEIEKAKAAVLYPFGGLPVMIRGETGVGKTTFAKLLYQYAKAAKAIDADANFASFNCADYAHNPQLIMAQLFGYAKGAYTGAEDKRDGLVALADGGILFLDEVHRLPEASQEMLFFLMDSGQYHRLGEADITRYSRPIIIMATTERPDSTLLTTFCRRIPITVTLPSLEKRNPSERLQLVKELFLREATKLGMELKVDAMAVKALLTYECPGNIGQLENDIKVACARAYATHLMENHFVLSIGISNFSLQVKEGLAKLKRAYSDMNFISSDLRVLANATNSFVLCNESKNDIYGLLSKRYKELSKNPKDQDYLELMLSLEIEEYFRKLMLNNNTNKISPIISQQAVDISKTVQKFLHDTLKLDIEERGRNAIAQHIHTVISRSTNEPYFEYPAFTQVEKENPSIYKIAKKLVKIMQENYHLNVPNDESNILANLILSIYQENYKKENCGILLICKAMGNAENMAKFANSVMNKDYVYGLDVKKEPTKKQLQSAIKSKLQKLSQFTSVLLLSDFEILSEVYQLYQSEFSEGIYVLTNISTSMVMEATIMAMEQKASAQRIFHHLKSKEKGYTELYELEIKKMIDTCREKVIITACISGFGASNKLKRIIKQKFKLPPEIEIITLDVTSLEGLKKEIECLSQKHEIICILGLDVGLDMNVPFISAVEFVLGDGVLRLKDILNNHQIDLQEKTGRQMNAEDFDDFFQSGRFLEDYLFYLSAEKIVPHLQDCVNRMEQTRGKLSLGKRVMLLIHLCSMLERLIFEKPKSESLNNVACDLIESCEPLQTLYGISINDEEYNMLEQILKLNLGQVPTANFVLS